MPPPGRLPTNARAWRCQSFAIPAARIMGAFARLLGSASDDAWDRRSALFRGPRLLPHDTRKGHMA